MKLGMKVIKKQQVGDCTFWLCEKAQPQEWATYVSGSDMHTEHGHYWTNYCNALADFHRRVIDSRLN